MNREIKFRAWHIGEEKMCNVTLIRPGVGAFLETLIPEPEQVIMGGRMFVPALESGRFCDMAEFHLMQYTGLKDKNGKEIFEGDIMKKRYYKGTETFDIVDFIVFRNLSFMLNDTQWEYDDAEVWVIGNVHENPDLIK